MKIIMTSAMGGYIKENGKIIPTRLPEYNSFLANIQAEWVDNSKVIIITASPNDYERNDRTCECFRKSFPMSGLSISYMEICDNRNVKLVEKIKEMDVVVLTGGHVPTQNDFFNRIGLKDRLNDFNGLLISWSAGSMNCADVVYAGPELDGEAIDPNYQRWIRGLGITKINIFPHFKSLREEWLDGFRLIEDITFEDSMGHEIIALNDGSYITIEDGVTRLWGEAYKIIDGKIDIICQNGMSVVLKA